MICRLCDFNSFFREAGAMADNGKIPARLYKYRAFNNLTLELLVEDNLFFADPSTFNDPLDTRPCLKTDLGAQELEHILSQFVERRVRSEMTGAAKTIKYGGAKTVEHIDRHSRRRADQLVAEIRYSATNPAYEVADPLQFLLGQYVEEELLRQYDKGIFSLAERVNCRLMWSHYGDQHKGVCVGYSVPPDAEDGLHKVKYGGSRLVAASEVSAMLNGDEGAGRRVDEAVLLTKAKDWRYEREWRLIGQRGLQDSPLELEEVVFGIRCKRAVKYAIVKALEDRCGQVKFYEMRELRGAFGIKKYALDTSELTAFGPRRARDIVDFFEAFES
jgi:hypothetical protein